VTYIWEEPDLTFAMPPSNRIKNYSVSQLF